MAASHRALALVVGLACLSGRAHAQDVVHYKFESGGGSEVVNYALGLPSVPRLGRLLAAAPLSTDQAWTRGRFGGGLSAGPGDAAAGFEVDTGWDHHVPGDLSIAMFVRVVHALPSQGGATMLATDGGGAGITMGIAGQGASVGQVDLVLRRDSSGSESRTRLRQSLLPAASVRWVHVAVTIDRLDTRAQVRWYVDGALAQGPELIDPLVAVPGSSEPLKIGQRSNAHLALDEVRIGLRVFTAGEISNQANQEPAASAPFGLACHPLGRPVLLDASSGGAPVLGNARHALTVYGLPGSIVALGCGSSDQRLGSLRLPLDLGGLDASLAGCLWRSSADLAVLGGTIDATGALPFPIPIPYAAELDGADVFSQALVLAPALGQTLSSNALATSVGR